MINITSADLHTIKVILAAHVPNAEVRAFGSRVTDTSDAASDLDLMIISADKTERITLIALKEDFESSTLPFRVDVVDWHRCSPEFREIIGRHCDVI